MTALKTLLTTTVLLASTVSQVLAAPCHDVNNGAYQKHCEGQGYSYRYETRKTAWAVAGPAVIVSPYVPKVMKTDPLTVDACLAAPGTSVTDKHAVAYKKEDTVQTNWAVELGVEVKAEVNVKIIGALGITGTAKYTMGGENTSSVSEEQTYDHSLTVAACKASKSEWKVIGMHDAKVQVPLSYKQQFRFYCSSWWPGGSSDWSDWITCGTGTATATGDSAHGCLSKVVETSSVAVDLKCAAVHPLCNPPPPTPTPTTTPPPPPPPSPTPTASATPEPEPTTEPTATASATPASDTSGDTGDTDIGYGGDTYGAI